MRPSKTAALPSQNSPGRTAAGPGIAATPKAATRAPSTRETAVEGAKTAAFTKAHAEARKEALEHAQWTAEMCSLAGASTSELVHMLKEGMDRNAVRHRLSATRNAAIGAEPMINGHHLAGLSEPAGSSWGDIHRAAANPSILRDSPGPRRH